MWLRGFSKLVCFATLFLVFVGSLVTSTGSGLAVPDWPLSYGTLFPPMVGGIFYEHAHRMVAATVGLLTAVLTIWIWRVEKRRWIKNLSLAALGAVIAQGILGGITVLFLLPKPISITHAVLAQTFFVLTVIIAYSLSMERHNRLKEVQIYNASLCRVIFFLTILVYCQLILGAAMRHTGSGLAIPDFPTMGGTYFPKFDQGMLKTINGIRFDLNLGPVNLMQIFIHFLHRLMALVSIAAFGFVVYRILMVYRTNRRIQRTIGLLVVLLAAQLFLGALTVLSQKAAFIASFHVATGAAILALCVLLTLQVHPLSFKEIK